MTDTPVEPSAVPLLTAPAIAAHWGVDGSWVRHLRSESAKVRLPEFPDLGADHPDRFTLVDEWRALHAPPRRRRRLADPADRPDEVKTNRGGQGAPGSSAPNTPGAKWWTADTRNAPTAAAATAEEIEAERVSISGDFEGWTVRAWETAAVLAVRRYREAMQSGNGVQIANALTAMNDTLRRAREQREAWLDLQERARQMISVNRAQDLLAPVLNALERRLKALGRRIGPDANPEDPTRAARAVDGEIDVICHQFAGALRALEEAGVEPATAEPPAAA